MLKELVILGAGGFAREASLLIEEINGHNREDQLKLIGFIDDNRSLWGMNHREYYVLGGFEALDNLSETILVICVIGDPVDKRKMVLKALSRGRQFINLIHPGVNLNGGVILGSGVLINKGAILTTNIIIGDHVSINPGCGVGHDTVINNFTTLMWNVNISGDVRIEEACLIGSGATVLQGISIGAETTIGAGAVVTKDMPNGCTAVGIPARVVKETPSPRPSSSR